MPFVYLLVIALAFAGDRVVKNWAAGALVTEHGGCLPLWEGVFQFTYCENRGAAFSLLQGRQTLLIAVTVLICLAAVYFIFFSNRKLPVWPSLAVSLALGGALGNLYDRVVMGYVIDMLDFCLIHFPVFNVADSCVNVGIILFAVWMVFFEEKDRKHAIYRRKVPAGVGTPSVPDAQENLPGEDGRDAENQPDGKTE